MADRTFTPRSEQPGHWWVDQLNNHDAVRGYTAMGEEIWCQTGGQVDAFVHAVGTAHSIHGAGDALRRHRSDLRIVAVEPAESAVLSARPTGSHRIEGIGIGFLPPPREPEKVDEIEMLASSDAQAMARRLAAEEGTFAGTSSGANVGAALRVAEQLGAGHTVVTIMERLYEESWRRESYDLHPGLRRLRMPTLVLHGDHDLIPIEIARRIAESMPAAGTADLA